MDNNLPIIYHFIYHDGTDSKLNVSLDQQTLTQLRRNNKMPPWCQLEVEKCSNCPLTSDSQPCCPLAEVLVPLVDEFINRTSHERVHVIVTTNERTISTNTTLQRGLSSLLGLVMATSGCPHTTPLKAMARFHLPFSTSDETIYRSTANYLLSQYFKDKENQDWQLEGLAKQYQQLQIVNQGITRRLRLICDEDAAVNAVVLLDLFAKDIPYCIDETLEEIRHLFEPKVSN